MEIINSVSLLISLHNQVRRNDSVMLYCKLHRKTSRTKELAPVKLDFLLFWIVLLGNFWASMENLVPFDNNISLFGHFF